MTLLPTINSLGPYAVTYQATVGGAAWPAANLIIYVQTRIPEACTALRVYWSNEATINGNCNFGLYSATGTKLWETGSTPHSGAYQTQFVDIADQAIDAGLYYMALQQSGTSAKFFRINPTSLYLQSMGVLQEAAASFALPATATFAKLAYAYLPICGIDLRGTV